MIQAIKKAYPILDEKGRPCTFPTFASQVYMEDGTSVESTIQDVILNNNNTDDAAKLGGKAPEYYLQPRNLLDNSDFRNPVNQKGQTSYTEVGYTIDRWYKENFSVLTVNDACTIDNTANSAEEIILQKTDEKTALSLLGKTVTLAMCLTDGTIYCSSGVVAYNNSIAVTYTNDFILCLHFFQEAQSYQLVRLIIPKGKSISVKWIALYEGEYTIDTLPPYVPKGYANELLACQVFEHEKLMANDSEKLGGRAASEYALASSVSPLAPFFISQNTVSVEAGFDTQPTSSSSKIFTAPADGVFYLFANRGSASGNTIKLHVLNPDGSVNSSFGFPAYTAYGTIATMIPIAKGMKLKMDSDASSGTWTVRIQKFFYNV